MVNEVENEFYQWRDEAHTRGRRLSAKLHFESRPTKLQLYLSEQKPVISSLENMKCNEKRSNWASLVAKIACQASIIRLPCDTPTTDMMTRRNEFTIIICSILWLWRERDRASAEITTFSVSHKLQVIKYYSIKRISRLNMKAQPTPIIVMFYRQHNSHSNK